MSMILRWFFAKSYSFHSNIEAKQWDKVATQVSGAVNKLASVGAELFRFYRRKRNSRKFPRSSFPIWKTALSLRKIK